MHGRIRLRVSGRVQGIWFRGWTREQALQLGLAGFAKNLADGSVEVLAEGPRGALDALEAACRRGPSSARVAQVTRTEETPAGDLEEFRIL
jgi:acylphosphatase